MTFSPQGPVGSYATLEENLESYNKIKEGFVEVFGEPDFSSEKVIDENPSNPFYVHSVYLVEDRWHVAHNRFELELVDNGDFGSSIILNCTPFFDTSDINYDYTNDFVAEEAK